MSTYRPRCKCTLELRNGVCPGKCPPSERRRHSVGIPERKTRSAVRIVGKPRKP